MTLGLLVRPDLAYAYLDFSCSELGAHLGGNQATRLSVAFMARPRELHRPVQR